MKGKRVLVGSPAFGKSSPVVFERLADAGFEVIPLSIGRCYTEEEVLELIPGVAALISGLEPVTARVLDAADQLQVVSRYGVGFDNVDLEAAKERGVIVTTTRGVLEGTVAEFTMGFMISLARQIPQFSQEVKAGLWIRRLGHDLSGKTLGIVGLGAIGREVCKRARAFGMTVVATDVYQDADFAAEWEVGYVELDELLAEADFVSLHVPVTPSTKALIGADELSAMKPSAYLMNVGRGALVDEAALAHALQEGQIAGAASDVFAQEPPGESPLFALDNFIATPHIGGTTVESSIRIDEAAAENVIRVLNGQQPLYRLV